MDGFGWQEVLLVVVLLVLLLAPVLLRSGVFGSKK
jgi:hypothetical protein